MAVEPYESGTEPEFVVYDMPRWEDAGDGLIRVYVASKHGPNERVEYSFICSPERLMFMCRKGLMFAAEAHGIVKLARRAEGH